MISYDGGSHVASAAPFSVATDAFPFRFCLEHDASRFGLCYAAVRLLTTMPRRPPTLRHRAVIARRRLLGEIRHLRAAEQLLVRTLRALSVEGAALQALVDAESSGTAAPAPATTSSTMLASVRLPASEMLCVSDVLAASDVERVTGSAPATEAMDVETVASSLSSVGAGLMVVGGLTPLESAFDSGAVGSARAAEQLGLGNVRHAFGLDDEDEVDFDF